VFDELNPDGDAVAGIGESSLRRGFQPVSNTDRVAQQIRNAILAGELKPGQPLMERDLAEQLGLSKTPIREALKLLSRSGLVVSSAYKGSLVRVVDAAMARSIFDVRVLLEPEAVRLAVPRLTAEHLATARSALNQASVAAVEENYTALTLWNREFHRTLYRHCGNPVQCQFLDQISDLVALLGPGWIGMRTDRDAIPRTEATAHEQILRAADEGDAERAAELTRRHVEEARDALTFLDQQAATETDKG
jgi:DNA-binding GntR family transcriptional regulator